MLVAATTNSAPGTPNLSLAIIVLAATASSAADVTNVLIGY
jgi:hypothetical protein